MIEILDFYADWCRPCKQLAPILKQIEDENDFVTVRKINVEEEGDEADAHGIRNIPTLLIMKDGILVEKIIGAQPKSNLLTIIKKHHNEITN